MHGPERVERLLHAIAYAFSAAVGGCVLDREGVAMSSLIAADGIHPSAAGEKVLADLIWKTMKENCMAQSAASGCCTP